MSKIPNSVIIRRVQNGYVVMGGSEYVFQSPAQLARGLEQLFMNGELETWVWANIPDQPQGPPADDDIPF